MDIRKSIQCISCGKEMKQGRTTIYGEQIVQNRHCECGLAMFLFNKTDKYDYTLNYEKKPLSASTELLHNKANEPDAYAGRQSESSV